MMAQSSSGRNFGAMHQELYQFAALQSLIPRCTTSPAEMSADMSLYCIARTVESFNQLVQTLTDALYPSYPEEDVLGPGGMTTAEMTTAPASHFAATQLIETMELTTTALTTIIKLPLEHNGIRDQQEELLASTVGNTLEKSDFALTVKHQFVLVAHMCQPVASLRSVMLDTKSAQVSQ